MVSEAFVTEFEQSWLPNLSDSGLKRLIVLLAEDSRLLINGSWLEDGARGCLATHAGWHHSRSGQYEEGGGEFWLGAVAGIQSAESLVIAEWDAATGEKARGMRASVLDMLVGERERRTDRVPVATAPATQPSGDPVA